MTDIGEGTFKTYVITPQQRCEIYDHKIDWLINPWEMKCSLHLWLGVRHEMRIE